MKVGWLDGQRGCALLLFAAFLMRSGGSQRGVKGEVRGFSMGVARHYVATALARGPGACAASALTTRKPIELALKPLGRERGSDLDLVATFPPACVQRLVKGLFGRLGLPLLLGFLTAFFNYAGALFFLAGASPSSEGVDSIISECSASD